MKILQNDGQVIECPADEVTHVVRHSAAHIMAQAISLSLIHIYTTSRAPTSLSSVARSSSASRVP